jgi:hypothetical protein
VLQRRLERLGQGQGVRAEGVAGLEQGRDAGMVFQGRQQPAGEDLDLPGAAQVMAWLRVDLGQHQVHGQVAELLLAAHVPVQRAGDHAQAGARARMLRASAPSAAMTARASATTCPWVSARRRVSWPPRA